MATNIPDLAAMSGFARPGVMPKLDETLSGLDPLARRDLCGRVAHLAATGVAVLLAARDLGALRSEEHTS